MDSAASRGTGHPRRHYLLAPHPSSLGRSQRFTRSERSTPFRRLPCTARRDSSGGIPVTHRMRIFIVAFLVALYSVLTSSSAVQAQDTARASTPSSPPDPGEPV